MTDKDKIEHVANFLCERATDGQCCLPDLTESSRKTFINLAVQLLQEIEVVE